LNHYRFLWKPKTQIELAYNTDTISLWYIIWKHLYITDYRHFQIKSLARIS